jgi:hypothetical protein
MLIEGEHLILPTEDKTEPADAEARRDEVGSTKPWVWL